MSKFKKLVSGFKNLLRQPSLINLILNDNEVTKLGHLKRYSDLETLPQITFDDLGGLEESVDLFVLDGGSLPTDIALLKILAKNKKSYFEIGTWRGESVWNVSKYIDDCTTLNLSDEEMKALGWNPKYAELHGVLSKRNGKINHVTGNTKVFDFKKLNKTYDLIFIDGDHSYEMVKNDTKKVFGNLIHENTIVVWHDYAFNPEKVRYEVFTAILDGMPKDLHKHLYHVQNTMCAVFIKSDFKTKTFESPKTPETIYEVNLKNHTF